MKHLSNVLILGLFVVLAVGGIYWAYFYKQGHSFEGTWSSIALTEESSENSMLNIEVTKNSIVAFGQIIPVNFEPSSNDILVAKSGSQQFTFHRVSENTTRLDVLRLYDDNAKPKSYLLTINSALE